MNTPQDSTQPLVEAPAATWTRRGMLAATALGGMGGGLWWSSQSAQAAGDDLPADFWQQTFDTPAGKPLSLASYRGQRLVINFWATWCPPCVKEMPELNQFHQSHMTPKGLKAKGWQVLGVAIDGPTPVREFLARTPVNFPIALAGFGGTELAQALGNKAGGLPFTVMIDAHGKLRQRKMGATHLKELQAWAKAYT
jgi:thiol-disulfide isomerase/thioredoxin